MKIYYLNLTWRRMKYISWSWFYQLQPTGRREGELGVYPGTRRILRNTEEQSNMSLSWVQYRTQLYRYSTHVYCKVKDTTLQVKYMFIVQYNLTVQVQLICLSEQDPTQLQYMFIVHYRTETVGKVHDFCTVQNLTVQVQYMFFVQNNTQLYSTVLIFIVQYSTQLQKYSTCTIFLEEICPKSLEKDAIKQ